MVECLPGKQKAHNKVKNVNSKGKGLDTQNKEKLR